MDNYTRMLELMDKEECKELLNCILQDTVEHIGLHVITNKNAEFCQNGYRFIENLLKTYKDERKQVY